MTDNFDVVLYNTYESSGSGNKFGLLLDMYLVDGDLKRDLELRAESA